MFDYYFFDLDGTLTDPAEGITNSFVHAIKYFGLEVPSYEKLCTFIGPPLVATFQKEFGFDEERCMEGVKKYREYFAQKGIFENKVYDGNKNATCTLQRDVNANEGDITQGDFICKVILDSKENKAELYKDPSLIKISPNNEDISGTSDLDDDDAKKNNVI